MSDDPTLTRDRGVPVVRLEPWTEPVEDDDPDANFKREVATYSLQDPMVTLENLGRNLSLPVGSVARYILARWSSGGSEALLELGPSTVQRMVSVLDEADADGTDAARLEAYETVAQMVRWVAHGLTDPEATYPEGGG